jgi:hypothetical protein
MLAAGLASAAESNPAPVNAEITAEKRSACFGQISTATGATMVMIPQMVVFQCRIRRWIIIVVESFIV